MNMKKNNKPFPASVDLFEDTSMQQQNPYFYNNQPGFDAQPNYYATNYNMLPENQQYAANNIQTGPNFIGQGIINDPMANMAMQYGQNLAGQGTEFINKNLENYLTKSNLKYYFAVDTIYVVKKLGLLVFPYAHKNWALTSGQNEQINREHDVNSRDLYIPVMAFVTYILLAGILLGMQNRFSPEQLGVVASTALIWMLLELVIILITKNILNITSGRDAPSYLDWLSYCGYKYVGMIIILLMSVSLQSTGYYSGLTWMSLSITFFLVRSLRFTILGPSNVSNFEKGNKRRLYMLLLIGLSQPIVMWWLTRRLAFSD